jgi:hypothetical protein
LATSKGRRKGPPRSFDSLREAKTALTNLADSLATHQFTWPAAAIRSYLLGGSQSLDEAFGLPEKAAEKRVPKKKKGSRVSTPAKARRG